MIPLVWRTLVRDWRAGEIRLMAAAAVLAVAATSTVGFFTDRVHRSLLLHANTLLAADLVVSAGVALPDDLTAAAQRRGLETSHSISFRTILSRGDALQLTELKAVDDHYPLRGAMVISDSAGGAERSAAHGPSAGRLWTEPRLLPLLGARPGDEVRIGHITLPIDALLVVEPDRGGDMFNIAPRAMIHLDDLERSRLIQPASRATYRLLVAGEAAAVQAFRRDVEARGEPNWRIATARNARPEVRSVLDRSEQFLGLGALISVLVAGLAIASAASRFVNRHLDGCALLRCLGLRQSQLLRLYALELLAIALAAGVSGSLLGYLAQSALSSVLGGLYAARLPSPSLWPVLKGTLTAIVALLGFSLPRIAALRHASPLRIFRREIAELRAPVLSSYAAAGAALAALAPWHSGDHELTLWVLLGLAATVAALALFAWASIAVIGRFRHRVGAAWRYGIGSVARRAGGSVAQIVAVGIGVMVLLLLGIVRQDVMSAWEARVPDGAPNFFLVNVQPHEVDALTEFLAERNIGEPRLFPAVRGRLVGVNGETPDPEQYADPRARRFVERVFNLSTAASPQRDNRVVAGRWWGPADAAPDEFSVEREFAETLGWEIGDRLEFIVGDQTVRGAISNLRSVDWESFNVNFFVVAQPGLLDRLPATFITSFYLPEGREDLLPELIRSFPSVTTIDVGAVLAYARGVMERVNQGVDLVFAFTLAAGLLVLLAAIQTTHDSRLREAAVMRALGANSASINKSLASEFLIIGLLSGAIGALGALLTGIAMARWLFELAPVPSYWVLPWGIGGAVLTVLGAGLLAIRKVLRAAPQVSLSAT